MNLKENLTNHLQELIRERDPYFAKIGHLYVQEYIYQQLSQWGKVERWEFAYRGKNHQNLILNLPGKSPNKNPILIGAHYDSVPGSPGADDNASGVAVLLELARAIALNPSNYPIQLVAFDLEEYGLIGSNEYAKFLHEKNQKLRLMISLEMLGYCDSNPGSQNYPPGLKYLYPAQGDYIAVIGNLSILPDLINISNQMKSINIPCEWLPVFNKGLMIPSTRLSDHSSFWDEGYNAIMITDTAFMRNPHYHKSSDTIHTLNLDFLSGICQGLINQLTVIS
ncbi:MAG TPA: M28 family peptidase [Allocoleopsis sp.]